MKIFKKIIAVFMAACFLSNGLIAVAESLFADVKDSAWYYNDVAYAVEKGLMNGTGNGRFSPNGSADRSMLVTILHRSAGSPAADGTTPFTDLKQSWYKAPVAWAYLNGIVNGTSATTFGPSSKITRQDLATILYRYAKNYLEYDVAVSGSLSAFPDGGKVSSYAKEAMIWANTEGLVNGELKGGAYYLNPKGNATRAQMAAIFRRFDQYLDRKSAEPPDPQPDPQPEPQPEYVTLPQFVGLSKEEAEGLAKSLGLNVVFITDTYTKNYPNNIISKQSSEKDVLLLKGGTITLSVNNTIYENFNLKLIDDQTTIWGTTLLGGGIAPDDPTVEHLKKGTYLITSLNKQNLPKVLEIPSTFNGIEITAIEKALLGDTTVETIIIPETITAMGINLCGHSCNCPTLKNIICSGETPFYLGSFSMDEDQLAGGCKIYVPDEQVATYKNSELGEIPFKIYADLILPISSLDDTLKALIS